MARGDGDVQTRSSCRPMSVLGAPQLPPRRVRSRRPLLSSWLYLKSPTIPVPRGPKRTRTAGSSLFEKRLTPPLKDSQITIKNFAQRCDSPPFRGCPLSSARPGWPRCAATCESHPVGRRTGRLPPGRRSLHSDSSACPAGPPDPRRRARGRTPAGPSPPALGTLQRRQSSMRPPGRLSTACSIEPHSVHIRTR